MGNQCKKELDNIRCQDKFKSFEGICPICNKVNKLKSVTEPSFCMKCGLKINYIVCQDQEKRIIGYKEITIPISCRTVEFKDLDKKTNRLRELIDEANSIIGSLEKITLEVKIG